MKQVMTFKKLLDSDIIPLDQKIRVTIPQGQDEYDIVHIGIELGQMQWGKYGPELNREVGDIRAEHRADGLTVLHIRLMGRI